MKRLIAGVLVLSLVFLAIPGTALAAPSRGGYGMGERIGRALLELLGARKIVNEIQRQAAQDRPQTTQQQLAEARVAKAQAEAAKARAQAEKAQLELERQRAKGQTKNPDGSNSKRPLHLVPISLPTITPGTTVLPVAAGLWWLLTHPEAWHAH